MAGTIPTKKPVPSKDIRDLGFNSEKMDEVINSESTTYTDRKGRVHLTIKGLEEAAVSAGPTVEAALRATEQANEARKISDNIIADTESYISRAEVSANSAETSALRSEAAADKAEAIADIDGTYPDTDAGLSATAEGKYFRVPQGTGKNISFTYYQKVNGQAIPATDMPGTALIDDIKEKADAALKKLTATQEDESDPLALAFTDAIGKLVLGITESGELKNKTITDIIERLGEAGKSLTAIDSGINEQNVVFGFVDKNNRLIFGLDANGQIINPTIDAINEKLGLINTLSSGLNDLDIVYGWTDDNNRLLVGFNSKGEILSPTVTNHSERIEFIESVIGSKKSMRLCIAYGQSNATGAVDLSQTWRTPAVWDDPLDGPTTVTNKDNGVFTLSPDRSRIIPLVDVAFGVIDGDGPFHGALDTTKKYYPQFNYFCFGHGRGSSSIEQLDKPTAAEIQSGSASGITIPTTSVEYQMLAASHGWDKLHLYTYQNCATPYYRGMWLLRQSMTVCELNGYTLVPDSIFWLQGENDANNSEGYADKLIAFYDQYTADIRTITGYTGDINMIIEQSNFSNPNDAAAINNHFNLNLEQSKAAKKAVTLSPMRRMYLAAPRYPLTNRIHLYPHAQRAHGEQMGKVYRKVAIEKQGWQEFTFKYWWLVGNDLYIKMTVPVPPLQFVTPLNATSDEMKVGKPYGFSYSGGDLLKSQIQIVGGELIKISFPDNPAGKELSYLKDVRAGSLCDSDETQPMFSDRWGNPNNMKNYCTPFIIKM